MPKLCSHMFNEIFNCGAVSVYHGCGKIAMIFILKIVAGKEVGNEDIVTPTPTPPP